ncbi:MAG: MMPL family transporter [Deltaproteobacteria bacterium]|nr:MMPL family transporter [Deltaproteobacteria bacterium]
MKGLPHLYKIGIRYPKSVIGIALLFSCLSVVVARNLKIETSMTALAPKDSESVRGEKEFKRYFGSNSYLLLTVEGPNAEVAEHFADELSSRMEGLTEVVYIDYRRPVDYFKKRQWLYLELDDLKEIERRIDRTLRLQKKGLSFVFSDLMDFADEEDRPDLNFDDIFKKYEQKLWRFSKYEANEAGNFIVMRVKVQEGTEDIESARNLVNKIKKTEQELKQQRDSYQPVTVGYTGTLQTTIEESDQIKKEMAIVSAVVAFILILILYLYFRRGEAIFLIGLPLLAGILWTGGIIYWSLGHLNLVTSFAGGILAGLGSDYGIYLLSRFYLEREGGKDFQTACRLTFENTGQATYGSMVTTAGAFVALLFSKFGVFFEFGLLGAIGVVLNYLAMIIVLPSLLTFFDRQKEKAGVSLLSARFSGFRSGPLMSRPVAVVLAAGLLITAAAFTVPSGSKIHFNEDMMVNKKLPGNRLYSKMDTIKGTPFSPTILITNGIKETEKTVKTLDQLIEKDKTKRLVFDQTVGLPSLIPPAQPEKKKVIDSIAHKIVDLQWISRKQKLDFLLGFKETLRSPPVTRENLPVEVKRAFESPTHKDIFAVYLFPAFSRLSSESLRRYHDGIDALKREMTALHFTAVDGTFVYDEIVKLIEKESPRGMMLIVLLLTAVMYLLSRSVVRTFLIMLNLLTSLVLLSAILVIANIPLNVMNIAAIPVILGTGIDSFVHFAQRYDESGDMAATLREKIPAIIFSNLTTIIGFGGFLLVSNPGLRSVGWVAVIGLTCVTLLSTFVFPRCLILEGGSRRRWG